MHALANLVSDPTVDGVLPVLLAADLNAGPDTPQLSILTEVIEDTWVTGGGDPDAVTLSSVVPSGVGKPAGRPGVHRRSAGGRSLPERPFRGRGGPDSVKSVRRCVADDLARDV